jgi:uncharacterized repeat protein (TIGR01451 family)/MYXO-CTERM domain-containing protein
VAVGLAGCRDGGGESATSGRDPVAVAKAAVFVNGDLESDAIGVVPTGWTLNTFLNPGAGITDTRPSAQTLASLNLAVGGISETHVVGGAQESQADPNLGATASLRYPKYGMRSAVVNYGSAAQPGSGNNVNQLQQIMTTSNADVDPTDNKVHVRFAIAPVLQSGGHPYVQQPYYYVELDNVTKGTILYQDFNAAAQAGVPWKVIGVINYTDWQLVDIGPGNAGLAVGDQVKLTIIASGCSQGGHFGRVYVDGVGSAIPGIYTAATGPSSVNAGDNITYAVTYKNGGTATALASQFTLVIPTGTTFQSTSIPAACSGVAVGGTGTLTCTLGDLAQGASGSFTVTLNANAGTSGTTVTNGNYSIQATGISALLGPKVLTAITSGVTYADVAITKTDGVAAVGWGQAVSYAITMSNAGPGAAGSVTMADTMPAQLSGATWTCAGTGGGTCVASGSGNISSVASLPVGSSVTYTLHGTIIAGTGTGSIANTATATLGGGVVDPSTSNNTAVDTDSIGVLRTLSVTKTNSNGGTVTSVPASIACGTSCSSASGLFVDGTSVVLTAAPVAGASFTSWGGACSGSSPTCTVLVTGGDFNVTAAFTPPPTINISTGDSQGAALGTAFAAPLKVQLLSSGGTPIVGATVLFSAPASGATAVLSSGSVTTDASGNASITAIASNTAGAYLVTASLSGSTISTTFSLWNYGTASTISVVSGNNQSIRVGTAFATPLTVVVRDAASQPVPGVTVTFATDTGATFSLTSGATNGLGQFSVVATATGLPIAHTASVSAAGVATPTTFSLTNTVGLPASIAVASGGGQSTQIGTAFPAMLTFIVRDSFSNVLSGVLVTFGATAAVNPSASLGAGSATTGAAGTVSVAATANGVVGSYAVTATVTGVASPASASLTNYGLLTIAPAALTRAPRATATFVGAGDPGATYAYSFTTNASGGTINASTGLYTAGATGNVSDVVKVTDSLSRTASATVTVGPGVSISPSPTSAPPRGSRTFVATGGSGTGFVFSFVTNASGGTINASTGGYTAGATGGVTDVVRATDSLGNSASVTISVTVGISLTPGTAATTPNGTVSFTAAGGSATGYVYAVTTNPSGGTVDASGRYVAGSAGSVTDIVTVTDSVGNTASSSVTVGAGITLHASGGSTPPRGALSFSATGGVGSGYVFSISANASGGTINSSTGAYLAGIADSVTDTIAVTDPLGNLATANVAVGPGVSLSPASPTAPPRGNVNLVASGGSGTGYVFSVTSNPSGGSVSASTGVYTAGATGGTVDVVRATDSLGNFATVAVSVGSGLTVNPAAVTLAPSESQTFASVGGSGAGYTFALTTNGSGGTIDPSTGVYTAGTTGNSTDVVTVTDSLGNSSTATVHVGPGIIIGPAVLSIAPLGGQSFLVSGGSGTGYTFALSPNGSGGTIDPSTGAYLAGSVGGVTDVVRVTDSLGNVSLVSVTVTAAIAPVVGTLMLAPQAATTVAVTGGAGGYSYKLTLNGSGATLDPLTGAYVAGSSGNSHDLITVTDGNGATATISVTVGPEVSLTPSTPSVAPHGPLTFSAAGGSGSGYQYSFTTNASGGSINASTGAYVAGATSNAIDVIQVVDSLGNIASVNVSVGGGLTVNPAAAQLAPQEAVTLIATGGSGVGYVFTLTSNMSGGSINASTGAYRAGIVPNVADQVTVTDSLGNTATALIAVGPGVLVAPAVSNAAPRGTVLLSVSGGSGTGYVFAVTGNNSGATIDASTGLYVAGASAAVTDTVTVTDSLGNTATATVNVGAGLSVSAASATTPPRGMIALTAAGGSGTYTFSLRNNGSGGSVVSTTGLYTAGSTALTTDLVEVSDDLGNTATIQITIGAGVSLSPASPVVAPNGAIAFTATGGSGAGYTFALTTNGSGGTIDPQSGAYVAGNTDKTTDVVTVSDSLGNSDSVGVPVGNGVSLNPPTSTVAPRATVQLTAAGGSGTGYVFSLLTNASGATIDAQSGLYHAGTVPNVNDVAKVVDSLGGSATAQISVGAAIRITPATATLSPLGQLELSVSGGSGTGYHFVLTTNGSGGAIDPTTGDYHAGPTGGTTDVVTVTDSVGNSVSATITVGGSLAVTPTDSTLAPRATLQLVATGGTPAYAFTISSNQSGGSINPSTGEYTAGTTPNVTDVVTVTDANGDTRMVTVHVGAGVTVSPADATVAARGTVQLTAAGGSGTGFVWRLVDNGAGGSIDPATGIYTAGSTPPAGSVDTVEVADSLGNTARATIHPAVAGVSASGGSRGCSCTSAGGPGAAGIPGSALGLLALALVTRRRRHPRR